MSNDKSILVNLIWKFSERVLAQLVTFIVSIVLARLLLPDDYGVIAMTLVFITVADVFVTSGFGNALIQKKDADNIDFSSVFYFNIGFSLPMYLLLVAAAPYIAEYYNYPIIDPVLKIMGIRVIFSGINSVQQAYVSRNMIFKKFFWSTFFGTIMSGIVGVVMAYMGFGVWALVAQYMTNSIINTLVLWFAVRWRPDLSFSVLRLKGLISYGWKILFEGVSNTIVGELRNLIIGKVYTPGDLGFYTKAQQFPRLLVDNISVSISSVLFPAMSLEQDDEQRVKTMLRKSIVQSSYLLFPMLMGLAVVAKPLVTILLTEKWLDCVPYMQIFCYTNAAIIGMIPRHQALNATGRSDVFMYEHIFARAVGIALLISVYKISVMAIALSGIASSIILSLTVMYTSKRFNHYGYKEQIADVLPIVILSVCMGAPVFFVQYLGMNDFFTLLTQVLLGVTIYTGLSVVFKPEGYKLTKIYAIALLGKIRS